jgi:hypothetical protein
MADNAKIYNGNGASIATNQIAGVHHQRVKVQHGAPGSASDVSAASPLPINQVPATTCTPTSVASSATSVLLLAANANRRGVVIRNQSTAVLYIDFGAPATADSPIVVQPGDPFFDLPASYSGDLHGIWAAANGNARIREFT